MTEETLPVNCLSRRLFSATQKLMIGGSPLVPVASEWPPFQQDNLTLLLLICSRQLVYQFLFPKTLILLLIFLVFQAGEVHSHELRFKRSFFQRLHRTMHTKVSFLHSSLSSVSEFRFCPGNWHWFYNKEGILVAVACTAKDAHVHFYG